MPRVCVKSGRTTERASGVSVFDSRWAQKFLLIHSVRIASGAHPASYRIDSGARQQLYRGLAVLATTYSLAPYVFMASTLSVP